jgi:hypothetical protein
MLSPVLSHRLREYAVGPKLRALRLRNNPMFSGVLRLLTRSQLR